MMAIAPETPAGLRGRTLAAVAILFCAVSYSRLHYWDEYFYLYSVWQHAVPDLIAMEAALADGLFPHGFFSGKLGFAVLLDALVAMSGPGGSALAWLRVSFCAIVLALGISMWLLARELAGASAGGRIAIVALFLPVPVYLGFKVLSEAPALLMATLGGWQLVVGLRAHGSGRWRHHVLAGAALACAVLTRFTAIWFFAGLVTALAVWRPPHVTFRRLLQDVLLVAALQAALAAAVILPVLGWPAERFAGLVESVTSRQPDPLVVGYGLAMTVQMFALPGALALRPPLQPSTRAALVWVAVAFLPMLLTSRYLEPRYFYTATLPLAILVSTGLDRVAGAFGTPLKKGPDGKWAMGDGKTGAFAHLPLPICHSGCVFEHPVRPDRRHLVWIGAFLLAVAINRVVFAPIMLYEIREDRYAALVADLGSARPSGTFVTPWLSDFCYLSFAFPSERIALGMTETYGTGQVFASPEFRRWMGPYPYAGDLDELERLPQPWWYVGWDYSPTVRAIDRRLRLAGLRYLDDPARRARLLDHLTPSWIWSSNELRLEPVVSEGQYRAFEIRRVDGHGR